MGREVFLPLDYFPNACNVPVGACQSEGPRAASGMAGLPGCGSRELLENREAGAVSAALFHSVAARVAAFLP